MSASRRQFLKSVGASAVLSFGAPVPTTLLQAAEAAPPGDERILVVIQLSGGNDGLNTVVPYADPVYRERRPTLAIPRGDVLSIDRGLGLHPSLTGVAELLEAGRLAIVQGVGYPQPNRSHFESMDIWHTCRRKQEPRSEGWLGRWLAHSDRRDAADVPAVHVGPEKQPLALSAREIRVPSIRSLEEFQLTGGDEARVSARLTELTRVAREDSDELLGFVQSSTQLALDVSDRVRQARRDRTPRSYPEGAFAAKLRTVAQLIDAGLGSRIYYVELDGFDTHSQQPGAHAALLGQWSAAMTAFLRDVAARDQAERVLVMSFSEFGRRVAENASEGTDHGAAAPVFLAGARVKPGLCGDHPSLTDLDDGDLKHAIDFRQVYAAVIERWLGTPGAPILGGSFDPVDVLRS